jgi:phosphoglycolate phosphatase
MKKAVIFDLDGTLLDTAEGICNSVRYAESKLGLAPLRDEQYHEFIGPPPPEMYQKLHGLSPDEAARATEYHREYSKSKGIYEAVVYEGISDLLEQLKTARVLLGVATYKRQDLAELILEHFGLASLFDSICGLDSENKLSKSDIIEECIRQLGVTDKSGIVYVGDSEYDSVAAQALGVRFIGVTYGYGFTSDENSEYAIDVKGVEKKLNLQGDLQ